MCVCEPLTTEYSGDLNPSTITNLLPSQHSEVVYNRASRARDNIGTHPPVMTRDREPLLHLAGPQVGPLQLAARFNGARFTEFITLSHEHM